MSKLLNKTFVALSVAAGLMAGTMATSYAAVVPAGVELADKQVIVRNNGSEPQSLDPHKIEGVPESHLARDLLEGITIVGPEGKHYLAPRLAGKIKISKSGPLKFAMALNGQMVTLSRLRILFIAGADSQIQTPRLLTLAICNMPTYRMWMMLLPVRKTRRIRR